MRSAYAAKNPENISHKTAHEEIPRAKKHVVFHFYKPLTPYGGELRHGQPLSPAILYKGQTCLVFAVAGEIFHKVLPRKCAAHKVAIERAQNIGKRSVRGRYAAARTSSKISVIMDMRENHLSYRETIRKYWGTQSRTVRYDKNRRSLQALHPTCSRASQQSPSAAMRMR